MSTTVTLGGWSIAAKVPFYLVFLDSSHEMLERLGSVVRGKTQVVACQLVDFMRWGLILVKKAFQR